MDWRQTLGYKAPSLLPASGEIPAAAGGASVAAPGDMEKHVDLSPKSQAVESVEGEGDYFEDGEEYEDFDDAVTSASLDAGNTAVRAPLSDAGATDFVGSYGSMTSVQSHDSFESAPERHAGPGSTSSFGSAQANSVAELENGTADAAPQVAGSFEDEVVTAGPSMPELPSQVRALPSAEADDAPAVVAESDVGESLVSESGADAGGGATAVVESEKGKGPALPESAVGLPVSSEAFNRQGGDKEGEDGDEDEWGEEGDEDDDDEDDDIHPAVAAVQQAFLQQSRAAVEAATAAGNNALPSLDRAPRARTVPVEAPSAPVESESVGQPQPEDETRQKLQNIRVKLLRLAHRLGQSSHNVVVAQVLYRLGLAEQLRAGSRTQARGGSITFDRATSLAEEQEAAQGGDGDLDFACTIMLLGKTGVGKSATINSIFDTVKTDTNAFVPETKVVREIEGTVHGIRVRVIDTPGLLPSAADQRKNEKVMASVKRYIKKRTPDIVLYFDRLDMQSRDYGDLPLLRTITETFGPAVWFNAIVVLTHAASAPPDGSNGQPVNYEMYVAQRSHLVQQTIRQAAGDMRLMNPVSLVENHPACRSNRAGQKVLPNGQVWKPQLLLLCFASKILAEANSLLKLQENTTQGRPFGHVRPRVPPLPVLLSQLLQSRAPLKMPDDVLGDEDDDDDDDLDDEEEDDDDAAFDNLGPFRHLTKEELLQLSGEQRRAYYEELAERERLFQRKQWKEELKRRKELKRRQQDKGRVVEEIYPEEEEEDGQRPNQVPVPMPDMALPPSFDSDNPTHRYRYLETANQWLIRPMLEAHGWDHDSGYDAFSIEKGFVLADRIPATVTGQVSKDKKEANLTLETLASIRHGEGNVTTAGLDIQTLGKDLAYTLRSETRFSNFKRNKTTGGLSVTLLGDTVSAGLKIEDRLAIGKRVRAVGSAAVIRGPSKDDVATGGSAEITLRAKDYPLDRTQHTLGMSIMDWHGDLAIGGNVQSQFILGKTMMVARANLNNRGAGNISIRASSNEQLQMALIGIIPMIRYILGSRLFGAGEMG